MHRLSNIRLPRLELRRRAPSLGLFALYAYLAFHAFSGSQGLLSWMSYTDEAKVLQSRLDEKQLQHAELKAQVVALSSEGLDLDALEIAVRRDLFVSGTNELTIWLDP